MNPIGIFRSQTRYPYDVPRQGSLNKSSEVGVIELNEGFDFEQALEDVDGFERIWLIYKFHNNQNWNPKTIPPRGPHKKRGVFATRSPYRPNPIGLTCVRLLKVEGRKLFVQEFDLLDQTPILDIKPYVPYADSFPDVRIGWLEGLDPNPFAISFSTEAEAAVSWLSENGVSALKQAIRSQLEFEPTDSERKRVSQNENDFILSYRTWRIMFRVNVANKSIEVLSIDSGYTSQELKDPEDIYKDKEIHRKFQALRNSHKF